MSLTFPDATTKKPSAITGLPSEFKRPAFGTLYGFDASGGGGSSGAFSNGTAVDVDGTNDQVTLGDASTTLFDFGTSDFSLSIWFNLDVMNGGYGELWCGHFGGGWLMYVKSSELGFYGDNTGLNDGGTFSTGSWQHGAVVRTSTNLKVFLNGSAVVNKTISSTAAFNKKATLPIAIGNGGNNQGVNGKVDEAAVWLSALTDSEISSVYNSGVPNDISTLNPIGWWRMGDSDGATGTTITDVGAGVSGTNVDGSLDNGASFHDLSVAPDSIYVA